MNLPLRRTKLNRLTPFSFSCSRCLRCCRHKRIQVNPYEIARLAGNRGISTTDFIRRFTTDGGTVLKWGADGVCSFLDSEGCSVHPDRPLVCRLYPLGWDIHTSGEESLSEVEPDPECKGAYGKDGYIMDFLEAQCTGPFIHAYKSYLGLFRRLHGILQQAVNDPKTDDKLAKVFQDGAACTNSLTDMDAAVTAYCRKNKIPFPKGADERMSVHIRALEAWANKT